MLMNKMDRNHARVIEEAMRIGGEKVYHQDVVIEVRYPYTNEVIGTGAGRRPSGACRAKPSKSLRTTNRN